MNYAELVLQPNSLTYGLYRIVYAVTLTTSTGLSLSNQLETYLQIDPSGLVLSALKLSSPMYGGLIEITRGVNQTIEFDPFIFSYDIDQVAVVSSLTFKYSCQVIDLGVGGGYPTNPDTYGLLYLDQIKDNSSLSSLNTCFNSSDNYYYDSSLNLLTLRASSLSYVPNRQYEIYVTTTYLNVEYYQKVRINVINSHDVPNGLLKCKYARKCKQYLDYTKINANDQLDLKGSCLNGCVGKSLMYSYKIFMMDDTLNQFVQFTNSSYYYLTGANKSDLTILSNLFLEYSYIAIWKVELDLNLTSFDNENVSTYISLTLYVNQPPTPGACDIDPKNGTTSDLFTIFCDQWLDDVDGSLVNFTFYGKKHV